MNPAYRRLIQDLPPRQAPDSASFPTDPKRVKAWIESLPRANQAATLRTATEALEALAGLRLDGGKRLDVLELLRPVLAEIVAGLQQQLKNTSFPLPEAKRQQSEQLARLQRGLVLGYRLVAAEICAPEGNVPLLRGGKVAQALQRAALHASQLLRQGYWLYRGAEPGVWECLHAINRFAIATRVQDKQVADEIGGSASVSQLYAHALLLAVSNPYRFSQREQDEVWSLTEQLALSAMVGPSARSEHAIAVPDEEDRGPGFVSEERIAEGGLAWLDIEPLRQAVDAALASTLAGEIELRLKGRKPFRLPHDIARKLRQSWGQAAERGHARLGADHRLDTVIGLAALHYQLSGGQDFDSFLRNLRGGFAQQAERDRAAWAHAGADAGRSPLAAARVLDQSLGGYRLSWDAEHGVRARVGELVGLSPAMDPELRTWMVGVIRWLRYNHDGSVDAGVELLARRAQAVGLRSIDLTGTAKAPLRGIQIQPLRDASQGMDRFVAPSVFDTDALQMEVSRPPDPDGIEPEADAAQRFGAVEVIENAGDYLLLQATPMGRQ
jgi:cyclic-di-GMP-binding protein